MKQFQRNRESTSHVSRIDRKVRIGTVYGQRGKVRLAAMSLLAGLAPFAFPSMAQATTSPSISLSTTTMPYSYSSPMQITVTGVGTDFVQGATVVSILDNSSNDTHTATNFQVSSPTTLSFDIQGTLGSSSTSTTYTVEVDP